MVEGFMYLLLLWGLPAFMVVRGYLKMDAEDKSSAMSDFKSPRFIFTFGFVLAGAFFAHAGLLFNMRTIQVAGFSLLMLGGILSVISIWKESKVRSVSILVVLSLAIFIYLI